MLHYETAIIIRNTCNRECLLSDCTFSVVIQFVYVTDCVNWWKYIPPDVCNFLGCTQLTKQVQLILPVNGLSSHIYRNNEFMQIQSNATRYQVVARFPQWMNVNSHHCNVKPSKLFAYSLFSILIWMRNSNFWIL